MSKRTISINPQFFNISKKKKKIVPSEVNINASNIRQLLLDKLKEHKRTRKIETKITPLLQDKTFDESCKDNTETKETKEATKAAEVKIQSTNENQNKVNEVNEANEISSSNLNQSHQSHKDKPYGNLKNGTKPTFKQMYQEIEQSQKDEIEIEDNPTKGILEEKEVKKTFKLGKSGKKISILIKNNKTRKKIEDKKTDLKKEKISTIKNYLKEKNLIKFGTSAPSKLLKEMYETSELCGGIVNQNKDVLIHNFDK